MIGLSSGLAKAARNLKGNIDQGVDTKEAVRLFAEEVEEFAEAIASEVKRMQDSHGDTETSPK